MSTSPVPDIVQGASSEQEEDEDDTIAVPSSGATCNLPIITDPNQPCITRVPYSRNDKYETATLTPVGQHAIAAFCKTEALIGAFNMPSKSFVIVKGTVTDAQMKRYSKAIAILIASRGQSRKDNPCSHIKAHCLVQCRTLPGVCMGACAYCRWVEAPKRCDYYTPAVTGKAAAQDRSRKTTTTALGTQRKRARAATSPAQDVEEDSTVPPEFRVLDGYVYQRIGRAVQREPREPTEEDTI